jgi:isopropylmalate/homocitrate/citramalate synthase
MAVRSDIILEDTTLRDGEQAPGIALSKVQKLEILAKLIGMNVKWIEVGIPKMGGEELEYLRESLQYADRATLIAWNRGVRDDVAFSLDLGFKAIHIGLPTSDVHLRSSVAKSRRWVANQAADLIKYAKDRGAYVSISAEDVGRTEPAFLQEYAGVVAEAGADRLRLSDTVGILSPQAYAERVRLVASAAPIDTQCHCHNDFGLAVANTLAGLEAGARYFHVCVNAMGERAGMPDLAQMAMALKVLYNQDVGVDTSQLTSLSALVSRHTGVPSEPWRPVVGRNVFAHESGIHSKGMLNDASSFEPMSPDDVGGTRRIVIGKHAGRAAIEHFLKLANVSVAQDLLPICLDRVRAASIEQHGEISPQQLLEIYRTITVPEAQAAQ